MRRHALESSSIESIGYDPQTAELEIEFKGGGLYRYFMVPPSVYGRLLVADSKGRFFAEFIRDVFRFQQA